MPTETASSADLASQILGLLGQDPAHGTAGEVTAEVLRRCTRDQLLEMARRLGLTGVSKLSKDALSARVLTAFEEAVSAENDTVASGGGDVDVGKGAAFHKFDLGPVP